MSVFVHCVAVDLVDYVLFVCQRDAWWQLFRLWLHLTVRHVVWWRGSDESI